MLGYGIDHTDRGARRGASTTWRADRAARIERMADRLCELGLAPDRAELDARLAAGRPLGRPHLAAAADRRAPRAPRARRASRSRRRSSRPTSSPAAPPTAAATTPTVPEAIDAIHAAGGVAVWAHPFWDLWQPERGARRRSRASAAAGLDGVEAFYATPRPRADAAAVDALADELGLLTTGSADFHGPDHRHFSRFRAFELHGCEPNLGPIDSRRRRGATS